MDTLQTGGIIMPMKLPALILSLSLYPPLLIITSTNLHGDQVLVREREDILDPMLVVSTNLPVPV
jgi:hypothetical protein